MQRDSWLFKNQANFITISGLIVCFYYGWLLFYQPTDIYEIILAGIFVCLSDLLDGYVARKKMIISKLGAVLDTSRDKLFLVFTFFGFVEPYWPPNGINLTIGLLTELSAVTLISLDIILALVSIIAFLFGVRQFSAVQTGRIKMNLEVAATILMFFSEAAYQELGISIFNYSLIPIFLCLIGAIMCWVASVPAYWARLRGFEKYY